jgi:plastocyanin
MPFRPSLSVAVALVALAGCGGAEEPPDLPGAGRTGETLTITAREYFFTPNRVTLRGSEGKRFAQPVSLRNQGELAHNIEISRDERVVSKLRSFRAGETRTTLPTLAPGRYEFVCTVADHDEKGMRGTLTVR